MGGQAPHREVILPPLQRGVHRFGSATESPRRSPAPFPPGNWPPAKTCAMTTPQWCAASAESGTFIRIYGDLERAVSRTVLLDILAVGHSRLQNEIAIAFDTSRPTIKACSALNGQQAAHNEVPLFLAGQTCFCFTPRACRSCVHTSSRFPLPTFVALLLTRLPYHYRSGDWKFSSCLVPVHHPPWP